MFPTDEFLKGAMFGAVIGGIITVVLLKFVGEERNSAGKDWSWEKISKAAYRA